MPILGYLILLNESAVRFLEDTRFRFFLTENPWKLIFIYYGSLFLGIASLIYAWRCFEVIKKYPSPVEYTNAELEFFATPNHFQFLIERLLSDMDYMQSYQTRVPELDSHRAVYEIMEKAPHVGPNPHSIRELLTWQWHLYNTSRLYSCYICAALYWFGFILLSIPASVTFLEVSRYSIHRLVMLVS